MARIMLNILEYLREHKKIAFISSAVLLCLVLVVVIALVATADYEENEYLALVEDLDPNRIRENLRTLTSEPHLAGTPRDQVLTNFIKDTWEAQGLEDVHLDTYQFLLSLPDASNPNKVRLLDELGNVRFESRHMEEDLDGLHENFVPAYNAYSPNATVKGQVVYVNFGTVQDFEYLANIGLPVKGKICIARYGRINRANKVKLCQAHGGIGVVLYSDPAQVAPGGTDSKDVYPNTQFLPESGIQRGTVIRSFEEPLSPGWPSIEGSYRLSVEEAAERSFPKIPCQPIGYGDAEKILRKLGGYPAPEHWQGKIKGLTYRLGSRFQESYESWQLEVSVHNLLRDVKSSNVFAYIRGATEPDRFVLVGNHRDAFGYGAIDPSSGTAALLEITRVLGQKLKSGEWRPRRTLVFANWAVEELGVMGSNEWMENRLAQVIERGVAHINTDICMHGPIPSLSGMPSLHGVLERALKAVPDPFHGTYLHGEDHWVERSYYDFYKEWLNQDVDSGEEIEPKIRLLGSGSDHQSSAFAAAVPSAMFYFVIDNKRYKGIKSLYPAYHTGIETFRLVDQILDPGFKVHEGCAKMISHAALELAEKPIIPYNISTMADVLLEPLEPMSKSFSTCFRRINLRGYNLSLAGVTEATREFKAAADQFMTTRLAAAHRLENITELERRVINDQLQGLFKTFLSRDGLPDRPEFRHMLFSPSLHDVYAPSVFSGISDLCHGLEALIEADDGDDNDLAARMRQLEKHLSDLRIILKNAAYYLGPVHRV